MFTGVNILQPNYQFISIFLFVTRTLISFDNSRSSILPSDFDKIFVWCLHVKNLSNNQFSSVFAYHHWYCLSLSWSFPTRIPLQSPRASCSTGDRCSLPEATCITWLFHSCTGIVSSYWSWRTRAEFWSVPQSTSEQVLEQYRSHTVFTSTCGVL